MSASPQNPLGPGRAGNPFPGLRPFESGEDGLFFGREGQSDEILRRLREARFVAIVGSSGSGKSSLIRAGLLPSLHGGLMAQAGSAWRVGVLRPGQSPIANLARALCEAWADPGEEGQSEPMDELFVEASLRRGSQGLIEAVRNARLGQRDNLLVVVDQFEELFRYAQGAGPARAEDEAAAFVKLLVEAVRQTALPIYVVITMRSDYIGDCARFRDLPETVNQGLYLIPRMTRTQQREAITGPVAVGGAEIAPRLVNRLLNDAGDDPDRLPILQHALMRTWDQWSSDHVPDEPLDLRHYEAIGGMEEALSRHADEAFRDLSGSREQQIARRLFQALTEKGRDHREVRRPIQIAEAIASTGASFAEVLAVIECFRRPGRSFLMPPASVALNQQSVLDISHESLIRGWQRLEEWVQEEAVSAAIYRRLAETAALYEQRKAGLWHDPDLQVALSWRDREAPNEVWAQRYHPGFRSAVAFLDASIAARDAEHKQQDRLRNVELRRTRRFATVVAIALLGALLLLVYGWRQRSLAIAAGAKATQQALIATQNEARATTERARAEASETKAKEAAADAQAAAERALAAQIRAEQKTREAEVANQDLASEVLSSRDASLNELNRIRNLADLYSNHSPPDARNYAGYEKVLALSKIGDHTAAIRQLTSILETDPGNLPARSSRAYEYLLAGNAPRAIEDADEFLRWDPRSASTFLNRGIARGMIGQYSAAIQDVRQAIDVNSSSDSGMYDSEVSPDIQFATKHKVLIVDGSSWLVGLWYELAVLNALDPEREANFESALKDADREAGRHPRSLDGYLIALNWAWLHLRFEDSEYGGYAVSGALWERAAEIQPVFATWAVESYRKFENARRMDPRRRYPALARWVSQRLRSGKLNNNLVSSTLERPPTPQEIALEAKEMNYLASNDNLVQLGQVQKKITEAISAVEQDKKQQSLLVRLYLQRVRLRFRAKDFPGVRADCQRILTLDPKVGEAYYFLAVTDSSEDAQIRDYEQALKYQPLDGNSLRNLSDLLVEKDPERALALLETAVRIWPNEINIRIRMARLQLQLKRNQEALSSANVALSLDPVDLSLYELRKRAETAAGRTSTTVELHLAAGYRSAGDFLMRLGKDSNAMAAYMKALDTAFQMQDEEMRLEQELSVRTLSEFLESRYSREEARQFWRSLAGASPSTQIQARARSEVARLTP